MRRLTLESRGSIDKPPTESSEGDQPRLRPPGFLRLHERSAVNPGFRGSVLPPGSQSSLHGNTLTLKKE